MQRRGGTKPDRYPSSAKMRGSEAGGRRDADHVGLASRLQGIETRLSGLEKGLRELLGAAAVAATRSATAPSPLRKKQSSGSLLASTSAAAGKKVFQHLQLERAHSAWSSTFLPNLEQSLKSVFVDVNPPLPTDSFEADLDKLRVDLQTAIASLVIKDIAAQKETVERFLKSAPAATKDRAAEIATGYAAKQFKREKPEALHKAISAAKMLIGGGSTSRQQSTSSLQAIAEEKRSGSSVSDIIPLDSSPVMISHSAGITAAEIHDHDDSEHASAYEDSDRESTDVDDTSAKSYSAAVSKSSTPARGDRCEGGSGKNTVDDDGICSEEKSHREKGIKPASLFGQLAYESTKENIPGARL